VLEKINFRGGHSRGMPKLLNLYTIYFCYLKAVQKRGVFFSNKKTEIYDPEKLIVQIVDGYSSMKSL